VTSINTDWIAFVIQPRAVFTTLKNPDDAWKVGNRFYSTKPNNWNDIWESYRNLKTEDLKTKLFTIYPDTDTLKILKLMLSFPWIKNQNRAESSKDLKKVFDTTMSQISDYWAGRLDEEYIEFPQALFNGPNPSE
jgi:hypothetical protein